MRTCVECQSRRGAEAYGRTNPRVKTLTYELVWF
ncbi:hypothetical protein BDI4_60057 [Burkholderia diffusa]|nr:hypothetical protein BDI4_60057 [Burkholderia diffusa]